MDSAAQQPERMRNRQSRFSRGEAEVMSTYTRSRVGEPHADRLLEWCTSPQYRAEQVRYSKIRTLSKNAVKTYVPDGIQREDFTEPLDGSQRLVFYFRCLYDAIKELLRNARFNGRQYTQAEVRFNPIGRRVYNSINSGKVFEAAQIHAGPGVAPVVVLLSSDATLVSKKTGGHPILSEFMAHVLFCICMSHNTYGYVHIRTNTCKYVRFSEKIAKYENVRIVRIRMYLYVFCTYLLVSVRIEYRLHADGPFSLAVSLANIHDDVRSEPGSWIVVGMIPMFNKTVAGRAGRPKRGPNGSPRRKVELLHQCYHALLKGWNQITEKVKILRWADGAWRRSMIFLGGLLSDQPEADSFCCDGSQTCKTCKCPKTHLVSHFRTFPLRNASAEQQAVYAAATGLFERDRRKDVKWKPTRACSQAEYERQRVKLGGKHLMENAFWGRNHFDVQLQVCIRTYLYVSVCIMYVYVRICTY